MYSIYKIFKYGMPMCGRFTLSSNLEDLKNEFSNNLSGNFPAKYNISPGQTSAVIVCNSNQYKLLNIEWGFKTFRNGNLIINARSETVNKKKVFQELVKFQRCLVPANSWFEWSGPKKPYLIKNKESKVISFAGLYKIEKNGEKKFIIITSEANGSLRKIHNRTPLVVKQKNFINWLGEDYKSALSILKPINNNDYDFHPVSPEIGKVSNDSRDILDVFYHKDNEIPLLPNLF